MRVEYEQTVDGGRVRVLVPEDGDDIAELERLDAEGKLDDRLSFADEDEDE